MELDRMRQELVAAEPPRAAGSVVVRVRLGGVWVPFEIERASLLSAVGLPQHEIFREGVYHEFKPEPATNGGQRDVDQEDEGEIMEF